MKLIFAWYRRDKMRAARGLSPDGLWNAKLPCSGAYLVGFSQEHRQDAEMEHLGGCKMCHQRFASLAKKKANNA